MNAPRISMIAAVGRNRELGKKNALLWNIPEDMKRFRTITKNHAVIMGRKTFESIGRPLPARTNIVVSRDSEFAPIGMIVVRSLEEALAEARRIETEELFIIGGGQLYALALPITDRLYITQVHDSFDADTYFPDYSSFNRVVSKEEGKDKQYSYTFLVLEKQ
ncbi:MAG: dihydrofolate reductase [Candidatus Roizmanbacteria bacterium]|nr:dihydrofolate reductase [Candidatus Roizmanbacteria bacterium]